MDRAGLVTGKPVPLLSEIIRHGLRRSRRILATQSGQLELPEDDALSTVSWNRRSPLSARSLILHAANLFRVIDEVIIVFSPTKDAGPFHQTSVVQIEDRVDAEVKGYLFLIREILAQLQKQGDGTLALVVHDVTPGLRSPIEAAALGSFVAIVDSLMTFYQNEKVRVIGCLSASDDLPGYADFVYEQLDRRSTKRKSRWMKYQDHRGLLSFIRR